MIDCNRSFYRKWNSSRLKVGIFHPINIGLNSSKYITERTINHFPLMSSSTMAVEEGRVGDWFQQFLSPQIHNILLNMISFSQEIGQRWTWKVGLERYTQISKISFLHKCSSSRSSTKVSRMLSFWWVRGGGGEGWSYQWTWSGCVETNLFFLHHFFVCPLVSG